MRQWLITIVLQFTLLHKFLRETQAKIPFDQRIKDSQIFIATNNNLESRVFSSKPIELYIPINSTTDQHNHNNSNSNNNHSNNRNSSSTKNGVIKDTTEERIDPFNSTIINTIDHIDSNTINEQTNSINLIIDPPSTELSNNHNNNNNNRTAIYLSSSNTANTSNNSNTNNTNASHFPDLTVHPTNSPFSRTSSLINHIKSIMILTTATQRYLKLTIYFFFLYFFTVVYNVSNKKVLDAVPLPCTISALVLFVGIPLFLPIWIVKPPRHLLHIDKGSYNIISLCHGLGHVATTYSLFSGSVSFTHVVKSAEPLFTALLSFIVTKKQLSVASYITLLPIVIGVGLASLKEFNFSWFGFTAAMASNFFYQLRMVLSKLLMSEKDDKKLSAQNTFRVITIVSFFQILVLAILLEGTSLSKFTNQLFENTVERNYLLKHLVIAGISFYAYNEIAFWILDLVHPITSAVGNTIKRVVLVVASIFIFRIPVSTVGMIGSTIAILGSLMYAITAEQSKEAVNTLLNNNNNHILTQQLSVPRKEELHP